PKETHPRTVGGDRARCYDSGTGQAGWSPVIQGALLVGGGHALALRCTIRHQGLREAGGEMAKGGLPAACGPGCQSDRQPQGSGYFSPVVQSRARSLRLLQFMNPGRVTRRVEAEIPNPPNRCLLGYHGLTRLVSTFERIPRATVGGPLPSRWETLPSSGSLREGPGRALVGRSTKRSRAWSRHPPGSSPSLRTVEFEVPGALLPFSFGVRTSPAPRAPPGWDLRHRGRVNGNYSRREATPALPITA